MKLVSLTVHQVPAVFNGEGAIMHCALKVLHSVWFGQDFVSSRAIRSKLEHRGEMEGDLQKNVIV